MGEFSNYVESRTPIADEDVDGDEIIVVSKGGVSRSMTSQQAANLAGSGVTREFNRAWSSELLFDKNEIDYALKVQDADINFTVASGGHLVNEFSTSVQRIQVDGEHSISFTGFNFIYGINSGEIPNAGTYQLFFLYRNGIATANWLVPSAEEANLETLPTPGTFTATPDGENEIDLAWVNVANASSYDLDYSVSGGGGPWINLATPAAGSTSYAHTGLSAGTTYHYRLKAVGDGIVYIDSAYAIAAGTTENLGDVDNPDFTFTPVSGATDVLVNQSITILADEACRKTDGTEITNANVASLIILKETNGAGANIPFTATIDVTKQIFTITPTAGYGSNQLVFVSINNVEDVNGNEVTVAVSNTFTTGEYTRLNGSSNYLKFGDILDSLFTANDAFFKLRVTTRNIPLSGSRLLWNKYSTSDNQRSFYWYTIGSDVYFSWARILTGASRTIKWTGVLGSGVQALELEYNGAIDTNDGLDRVTLKIGGVTQGSKTLEFTVNVLGDIVNSTAQLAFAAGVSNAGDVTLPLYFIEEAKDLQILSAGDVMEINVPNIIEGTDTSGNNRHGTWV
jgi:hypothetical protein